MSVGETRVAERRALMDAAANGANDELDDVEQLVLVDELDVREHDLARHFDVYVVAAVDHDFCYTVVANQGLDRPQLLVILIDIDPGDPNCHSSASRW